MNLGTVWLHLDIDDKKLIQQAICNWSMSRPNSYLYKHRLIQHDDPKLMFLKIKPVYYALKLCRNNSMIYAYGESISKIDKILNLIEMIIK